MLKLITKQGLLNIKNRWKLYVSYLIFLFVAFLIIFAFFGFAFNFDHESHKIINLKSNPTYVLKLFNYSLDETENKRIKNDEQNNQDLFSFLQNKFPQDQDQERLEKLLTKSGQQNGYLKNNDFDLTKEFDQTIQKEISPYGNNFLIYWFYESKIFTKLFLNDKLTAFDSSIKLENSDNNLLNISTFKIENWNNSLITENREIKIWQKFDYINEFYWLEKGEILQANKDNQIVITPKFAQLRHLKVGDSLEIKFATNQTKTLKIVGIAIKRNRALVNNSQDTYISPLLYNEIVKNNFDAWIKNLNVVSPLTNLTKNGYDSLCLAKFNQYEGILNHYFENLNQKPFGTLKTYQSTSSNSLDLQVFTYYLLMAIICFILIGMIIVIYLVISQNNIQQQKEQIFFLKSLGTSNNYLTYFILITILPFVIIVYFLALGSSKFVYQLFCSTLANSIGFDLPSFFANSWQVILLIILLLSIIFLISYFIIWGKIKKLSLIETNQNQNISFNFKTKMKKICWGQASSVSTVIQNLGKSIQLFLISFFTFLAIGVTLEFTNAINNSAKSNQEFFQPYRSYSYQIFKTGQVEYDSKNTADQLLNSSEFSELKKANFSNAEEIINWFNEILKEEDISHQYFNQTKEFSTPQTLKTIKEIQDQEIQDQLLKLYEFVFKKINLYHQYFGKSAPDPIINFKYTIFPNHYWFTTIFKTSVNNQIVNTFVDQKFDSQVSQNGVIVNYLLAKQLNLKIGDLIKIDYFDLDSQQQLKVTKTIEKIETKINDNYQIILNSEILKAWTKEKNALFSQENIPIGLKYITMPIMKNDGLKLKDYWDFNQEKWNDLNIQATSFEILEKEIANRSLPYTDLLLIISLFMLILSIIVLVLIGLMFSLENQRQILLLKVLGYDFRKIIKPIIYLFSFNLIISWILAAMIATIIIQKSSHLLLSKILVELHPVYNFQTLGINLLLGLMMLVFILVWIKVLYKKSQVNDLQII